MHVSLNKSLGLVWNFVQPGTQDTFKLLPYYTFVTPIQDSSGKPLAGGWWRRKRGGHKHSVVAGN